jgi:hypothetical protein
VFRFILSAAIVRSKAREQFRYSRAISKLDEAYYSATNNKTVNTTWLTSRPERRRLLLSVSVDATVPASLLKGLWLGALVEGLASDEYNLCSDS